MRCLTLADDCGITPGATEAILRCLDAGRLYGTAVMAGAPYAREAAQALGKRLAQRPSLRVGVHLNLLEGNCTAPAAEVLLLADAQGRFKHSLGSLWAALAFAGRNSRTALLGQIAREWQAQAALVHQEVGKGFGREDGFSLYLDGHLHVHTLPALRPVLLELLEGLSVSHVRIPAEPRYAVPAPLSLQLVGSLRRELLSYWSEPLRGLLQRRGISTPDLFIGAFCSGAMTLPRLEAGLACAQKSASPESLVEIMFHPGGFTPEERRTLGPTLPYADFYSSPNRSVEYDLLLSPEFEQLMLRHDPCFVQSPNDATAASCRPEAPRA